MTATPITKAERAYWDLEPKFVTWCVWRKLPGTMQSRTLVRTIRTRPKKRSASTE